jgi:hypothetical protein
MFIGRWLKSEWQRAPKSNAANAASCDSGGNVGGHGVLPQIAAIAQRLRASAVTIAMTTVARM